MRSRALLVAPCILAALSSCYADDWTMYLGDLGHTSFRPGETQIYSGNAGQLQQLWRTPVGAVVASGVTVSGGSVFFGDWNGNFHSLNAATGAAQWSQFLGKAPDPADASCQPRGIGVSGQPLVSGNFVYVGGGDSKVYAMDRSTGAILWSVQLADPAVGSYLWSSPMLYQNALYIGIASLTDCPLVRGGLARIPLDNPTHPQIVYFTPADTQGASLWSTPAIDSQSNMVYLTTGNGGSQDAQNGVWGSALLGLDATTLEVKSHFFMPLTPEEDDADWGSSPVLFESGGQSLVAANGKNGVMYVLSRPDLALVWSYKLARDCDSPTLGCGSISTPAFDGTVLVTGAGQPDGDGPPGTVYAFDPAAQSLLWMYPANGAVLAPVTLTPGLVFVATNSGLAVLDTASGTELWTDSGASGGIYGQPVVSNGVLYTAYVKGDIVAWGPSTTGDGSSTLAVSPSSLQYFYTGGGPAPSDQTVSVTAAGASATFTALTDSPWMTTGIQTGATPATITIRANPSGMDPGVYNGSLNITSPGNSAISVPVTLVINPTLTSLSAAGIVNAASAQPGLAPGSLFTIFAGNLSSDTTAPAGAPWPLSWHGISVKINGVPAPLGYVSPTQINAQAPFEIAPGPGVLTVESNGATSGPVGVNVQAAAPGIFMGSDGRAAAVNQDGTLNQPDTPASTGNVISLFLTGQGLVNPPVASGSAAPPDALSGTAAETTATIGGLPATVSFSGLAPGFVGLAQVNLTIPDLPAGDQPVVVIIGGVPSNAATISVTR